MNQKKILRIATRKSPLAFYQANSIKEALKILYPALKIELLPLQTAGDKQQDTDLSKLGGKGLFVKELEKALLDDQADIAVHAMKDVPMNLEEGLVLGAICLREDPRDVLISQSHQTLSQLPAGSSVGTSSSRRQSQLMAIRADLQVSLLRGNVGTRLNKLAAGKYNAIILAAAGLIRLGKIDCISQYLEISYFLPAPGQGALGIECRENDFDSLACIKALTHLPTYYCVTAERSLSRQLGGNCQVPIAAYATFIPSGHMKLQALVGKPDGTLLIKAEKQAAILSISDAEKLGMLVAQTLREQGADVILQLML